MYAHSHRRSRWFAVDVRADYRQTPPLSVITLQDTVTDCLAAMRFATLRFGCGRSRRMREQFGSDAA